MIANRNQSTTHAVLDGELVKMARGAGHHGVTQFIEYARQRCRTTITPEYACDLLARGGYPNPKA